MLWCLFRQSFCHFRRRVGLALGLGLLVLACGPAASAPALDADVSGNLSLPEQPDVVDISKRFSLAVDASRVQTLAQMQQATFEPLNGRFAVGYDNRAFWLRFSVSDSQVRARQWWLEIAPALLDRVELYEQLPGGGFSRRQTGDRSPFSTRDIPYNNFVFALSPQAQPTTYYLRVESDSTVWVNARIWHASLFAADSNRTSQLQTLGIGAVLLLLLTSVVQGIVFRQAVYVAFVAYVAVTFVLLSAAYLPLHFPSQWYLLGDGIPPVATCLSVTAYAVFCHYFLYDIHQARLFKWAFFTLSAVGLVGAVACIWPQWRWLIPGIVIVKIVGTLLPLWAASGRLLRGSPYDRLVWLGIFSNVLAQAYLFLVLSGTIDDSPAWARLHGFTTGMVLHVLLLSFALFERMRLVSVQRDTYQREVTTQRLLREASEKIASDQRSFLAMVAHELRGPLAVARSAGYNLRQLLGPADVGITTHPTTQATNTRLDRIDTSLAQMAALVETCLAHERQGASQPLSLHTRVRLADVQAAVQGLLRDEVAQRVQWPLDKPVNASLPGDQALLAIALRNLLENACRYDTTGAQVEVSWQEAEELGQRRWQLQVQDRGPGLPAAQRDPVFSPFARGSPTAGDGLGLGLGLYIVQRIASMHGGHLAYGDRPGGGAVFTLSLPVLSEV